MEVGFTVLVTDRIQFPNHYILELGAILMTAIQAWRRVENLASAYILDDKRQPYKAFSLQRYSALSPRSSATVRCYFDPGAIANSLN
jgi:hypothetical protein